MQIRKHKRKMNHVVIVTSDAVDANVKQFRIRPWVLKVIIFVLCVIIGALIGYLNYEEQFWQAMSQRNISLQETVKRLEEENAALSQTLEQEKQSAQAQVEELNEQIQILSDTVKQKLELENELTAKLESQSLPTEFPLTGSASMEESEEEPPMCIFTASVGTTVVATASGTVMTVNEDEEYGHNVYIDHGNGYITIYRNDSEPNVKVGDSVVQGTTLFMIGEDNTKLGYQMQKDEAYINPMDMLAISG